jgi:Domain of unknown function (DUF4249)
MKNNAYKISLLGAMSVCISSLFVSSCIRRLDVNLPQGSAQLVVNTHLTNDEMEPIDTINNFNRTSLLPNVQLSSSADPLDPQPSIITDRNALVQITENGAIVASGVYSPYNTINSGYYNSVTTYDLGNFKPQPNKTYTLRVKTTGFEESSATTTTTSAMQNFTAVHTIDSTSANSGGGPNGGRGKVDRIKITVKDDAATTDFYEVKVSSLLLLSRNGSGTLDTVHQIMNTTSDNPAVESFFSGNALLSDKTFNGQNFSFDLLGYNNNGGGYYDPVTGQFYPSNVIAWQVRMYKITKERYAYQKSVQKQRQSGNGSNPFSEPSFVYSNMNNGFGIFSFGLGKTVQAEMR